MNQNKHTINIKLGIFIKWDIMDLKKKPVIFDSKLLIDDIEFIENQVLKAVICPNGKYVALPIIKKYKPGNEKNYFQSCINGIFKAWRYFCRCEDDSDESSHMSKNHITIFVFDLSLEKNQKYNSPVNPTLLSKVSSLV